MRANPRKRARVILAAVILVGAASLHGSVAATEAPRSAQAPDLYVSPSGNDGGSCSRSSPCASWDAAYKRARPGDVIELAGGGYPGQTLTSRVDTRHLSPGCTPAVPKNCVIFRPATGATVAVGGSLQVNGASVWIDGAPATEGSPRPRTYPIRVSGYTDIEATTDADFPDHVVLQGISTTSFGVFGVDTALLRDLDVGPATVGANCQILQGPGFENKIGSNGDTTVVPRHVTLDQLVIHNQNRDQDGADSDCHFGGLFLVTADDLTIERSLFFKNAVYNLQAQNFGGAPAPTNVTIQNDEFGCPTQWLYDKPKGDSQCDGQADIQFNAATIFANWLVRFNSFVGGIGEYVDGATFDNVRFVGNVGARTRDCFAGTTYMYNAWTEPKCSATDRVLTRVPFVSSVPGEESFRLVASSSANALVPPGAGDLAIGSDAAGQVRPTGYPRAAGALERDTSVLLLGRSIGHVRLGMPQLAVIGAYGAPVSRASIRLGLARTKANVQSFAVPGGRLRVTMTGGIVAGLSTASPFYATVSGLGAGAPLTKALRLPHATWVPCAHAVRVRLGSITVLFGTTPARRTIARVSMFRSSLLPRCDAPPSP